MYAINDTWVYKIQHIYITTWPSELTEQTERQQAGMPNTHTGSPMALYLRKMSCMKFTLPERLLCAPVTFFNNSTSSSSGVRVWTILQYFLKSNALTFDLRRADVIVNEGDFSLCFLQHLSLMHDGTNIVMSHVIFDSWMRLSEIFRKTLMLAVVVMCSRDAL